MHFSFLQLGLKFEQRNYNFIEFSLKKLDPNLNLGVELELRLLRGKKKVIKTWV